MTESVEFLSGGRTVIFLRSSLLQVSQVERKDCLKDHLFHMASVRNNSYTSDIVSRYQLIKCRNGLKGSSVWTVQIFIYVFYCQFYVFALVVF